MKGEAIAVAWYS